MRIRPFKLINASEEARLKTIYTRIAEAWGKHWLLDWETVSLECMDISAFATLAAGQGRVPSGDWREYADADGARLYVAVTASVMRRFATLAFGGAVNNFDPSSTGPSEMLGGVFESALRDLAKRFWQAANAAEGLDLQERHAPPSQDIWLRGSGAVAVKFPLGKDSMQIVLDGPLVRKLLRDGARATPPRVGPVDVRECITGQKVSMQLWAGEVEVDLGLLHSLAPGDVIRLDSSIHEPLRLTVSWVQTNNRAYLGCAGGRKAVQLTTSH